MFIRSEDLSNFLHIICNFLESDDWNLDYTNLSRRSDILFNLVDAILLQYAGLMSNPMKFLDSFLATTAVVPLPMKGSRTMPLFGHPA